MLKSKDDISILKLAEGNNGLVTEETIGVIFYKFQ